MQNKWQAAPKIGEVLVGARQAYENEYVAVWEKNRHADWWHFVRRYVRSYAKMLCCENANLVIFQIDIDPNNEGT